MEYTPNEQERKLCEMVYTKFRQAYVAKAPFMEKWQEYMKAYKGELFFNQSKPDYKSNEVTNLIFATIESIRPIMTDNNPKFLAEPTTPEGAAISEDVQVALNYEWSREKMDLKLPQQLLPLLIYGTCIWFVSWDAKKDKLGNVSCKPIDPFNIFPDPLADSVDSAEYIIYATYKHANQLKQAYPKKASVFVGSNITHSELVAERDKNAVGSQDQILCLEMWYRDWASLDEIEENGEKKKVAKYPNGRVITCCPHLGVVLDDKANPYKDGKFPFIIMKDYDIPFQFWGGGEVEQIISPQEYLNELTNQIIDNAKNTANMQWIIDKNSGIATGKLTNRPGLVVRKNPGSIVERPNPPAMPQYVRETIETFKKDIQDVSGVFDSLKGEKQTGVVAAQAIMALQEASQGRIRLKIKIMENNLGDLATMWYSRMQQFWKFERYVLVTDIENNMDFRQINPQVLQNDFDIKITAGSTMPTNKNAMLDMMIRLAQTSAEDGMPIVDRKAMLEFIPNVDKKGILDRYDVLKQQQQAQQQAQLDQQGQMQQAQMVGEQQTQSIQEALQGISQMLQQLNQEVNTLMQDKMSREEQEEKDKIHQKGYDKGFKDGIKGEGGEGGEGVEEITPQQIDEDPNVPTGEIPMDALNEINQLSPEQLKALLEEYPELLEMLQGDTQMLGGGDVGQYPGQ